MAIGYPLPLPFETEVQWFERIASRGDSGNVFFLSAETISDGQYIGYCSCKLDWKNRTASVICFVGAPANWGHGLGTDMLSTLCRFLFSELNVNKVSGTLLSHNERGIRLGEKCGFKVEAVRRQAVFRKGVYLDRIVVGLLREEWEEQRHQAD
jgi:RimJ/RimL family protein N-acetyltransferase